MRAGLSHRLCTAPMMAWSDRHCRFFFRQLAPHAIVYTEMIPCGALVHGDVARHLDFARAEHPVALQLGGCAPEELAYCARLGERWGYDEINLNCGCPSERVQRGAFGACLMAEPELVASCIKAMRDAVSVPVSVKHRLGIDRIEDYGFVRRFVETLAHAGCRTFIVHARNAVLKGLSPKDNREIPALRHAEVHRLKREFPEVEIVINGGIAAPNGIAAHLPHVDGIMLGRAAYHDPYSLAVAEYTLFGGQRPTRAAIVHAMHRYAGDQIDRGTPLHAIARHMLGLYRGRPGARTWRRLLSDAPRLAQNDANWLLHALNAVEVPELSADAPARFADNARL